MEIGAVIGGTIGMLTLAGGLIGVYVSANQKIMLTEQSNSFLREDHERLEKRVGELEKKVDEKTQNLENRIFHRLDVIAEKIEEIKITIAKR